MKKVFSSLILVIARPLKYLKRSKLDNFVGGLIFGAIFSLVVNLITVQFQDMIDKQRTLEAIENEITSNYVWANSNYDSNAKLSEEKQVTNPYFVFPTYKNDFWSQSSEAIRYVAQLDPDQQMQISTYYDFTIKASNQLLNKADALIDEHIVDCYSSDLYVIESERERCLEWSETIRGVQNIASGFVIEGSENIMKVFHPTKDRLKNPLLKIFMGKESMKILSGK